MPNNYITEVTITGSTEDLTRFKSTHFVLDEGTLDFDFNTVILMPEILNGTESSSTVSSGLIVLGREDLVDHGTKAGRMLEWPWVKEAGVTDIEGLKELLKKREPDCIAKAEVAIKAHEATGYLNWYDWSVANWGTKWDAYELKVLKDTPDQLKFRFQTAWAPPIPVLNKLMEMYPDLNFKCRGRDEFERSFEELEAA